MTDADLVDAEIRQTQGPGVLAQLEATIDYKPFIPYIRANHIMINFYVTIRFHKCEWKKYKP